MAPQLIATVPDGVTVLALTVWRDVVILATSTGVYVMADPKQGFQPVEFPKPPEA